MNICTYAIARVREANGSTFTGRTKASLKPNCAESSWPASIFRFAFHEREVVCGVVSAFLPVHILCLLDGSFLVNLRSGCLNQQYFFYSSNPYFQRPLQVLHTKEKQCITLPIEFGIQCSPYHCITLGAKILAVKMCNYNNENLNLGSHKSVANMRRRL